MLRKCLRHFFSSVQRQQSPQSVPACQRCFSASAPPRPLVFHLIFQPRMATGQCLASCVCVCCARLCVCAHDWGLRLAAALVYRDSARLRLQLVRQTERRRRRMMVRVTLCSASLQNVDCDVCLMSPIQGLLTLILFLLYKPEREKQGVRHHLF